MYTFDFIGKIESRHRQIGRMESWKGQRQGTPDGEQNDNCPIKIRESHPFKFHQNEKFLKNRKYFSAPFYPLPSDHAVLKIIDFKSLNVFCYNADQTCASLLAAPSHVRCNNGFIRSDQRVAVKWWFDTQHI